MSGPLQILKDPSVEGFIEFIHTQPSEREISHYCWDTDCVCDYMHHTGRVRDDIMEFIETDLNGLVVKLEGFEYIDFKENVVVVENVFQLLDEARIIETAGCRLSTYGDLSEVLKAHLICN